MADVYGVVVGATTVGANTRTTEVGVDHGTPALAFINVALTGIETSFANSNSTFHLVTAALDGFAEMYGIGTPDSGNCVYVVHANHLNSGAVDDARELARPRRQFIAYRGHAQHDMKIVANAVKEELGESLRGIKNLCLFGSRAQVAQDRVLRATITNSQKVGGKQIEKQLHVYCWVYIPFRLWGTGSTPRPLRGFD